MSAKRTTLPRFRGFTSYEDNSRSRALFFGREKETAKISESIYPSSAAVVYGASGIGKSSLINCGLIGYLKDDRDLVPLHINLLGLAQDVLFLKTPQESAIATFNRLAIRALREADEIEVNSGFVLDEAQLEPLPLLLRENAIGCRNNPDKRLVFIFDQFESLFLINSGQYHGYQQQNADSLFVTAFLDQLAQLIDPKLNDKLYNLSFSYSSSEMPSVVLSILESELGELDYLRAVSPLFSENQIRIRGLTKPNALLVLKKLSETEFDDEIVTTQPFQLDERVTLKIIEHSPGSTPQDVSPFYLQLYGSWMERSVQTTGASNNESRYINKPRKNREFADYLTKYYQWCLDQLNDIEKRSGNIRADLQKYGADICQKKLVDSDGHILLKTEKELLSFSSANSSKNISDTLKRKVLASLKANKLLTSQKSSSGAVLVYQISHSKLAKAIVDKRKDTDSTLLFSQAKAKRAEEEKRLKRAVKLKKRAFLIGFSTIGIGLVAAFSAAYITYNSRIQNYKLEIQTFKQEVTDQTSHLDTLLKTRDSLDQSLEELKKSNFAQLVQSVSELEFRIDNIALNIGGVSNSDIKRTLQTVKGLLNSQALRAAESAHLSVPSQKIKSQLKLLSARISLIDNLQSQLQKDLISKTVSSGIQSNQFLSGYNWRSFISNGLNEVQQNPGCRSDEGTLENQLLLEEKSSPKVVNANNSQYWVVKPLCRTVDEDGATIEYRIKADIISGTLLGATSGKYSQKGDFFTMLTNTDSGQDLVWGVRNTAKSNYSASWFESFVPNVSLLELVDSKSDHLKVLIGTLDGNLIVFRLPLATAGETNIKVLAWKNVGAPISAGTVKQNERGNMVAVTSIDSEIQVRSLDTLQLISRFELPEGERAWRLSIEKINGVQKIIYDVDPKDFSEIEIANIPRAPYSIFDLKCDVSDKSKLTATDISFDLSGILVSGKGGHEISHFSFAGENALESCMSPSGDKNLQLNAERILYTGSGLEGNIGYGIAGLFVNKDKPGRVYNFVDSSGENAAKAKYQTSINGKPANSITDHNGFEVGATFEPMISIDGSSHKGFRADKYVSAFVQKNELNKAHLLTLGARAGLKGGSCVVSRPLGPILEGVDDFFRKSSSSRSPSRSVCDMPISEGLLIKSKSIINWVEPSHDDKYVAAVDRSGEMFVINMANRKLLDEPIEVSNTRLWKVKFSPILESGLRLIVTLDKNGVVKFWTLNSETDDIALAYKVQIPGDLYSGNLTQDMDFRCNIVADRCLLAVPVSELKSKKGRLFIWDLDFDLAAR